MPERVRESDKAAARRAEEEELGIEPMPDSQLGLVTVAAANLSRMMDRRRIRDRAAYLVWVRGQKLLRVRASKERLMRAVAEYHAVMELLSECEGGKK